MMEGIGSEVSQKIRSAIKAKLVELGAYSDDELPEYILVMVANKRSKSQMEEDLQLFLGTNTQRFTTWLHQVLQKLEEVKLGAPGVKKAVKSSEASLKEKPKQKEKEKNKEERKRKSSTSDVESSKKEKRRKSEEVKQGEHAKKDDKPPKSVDKEKEKKEINGGKKDEKTNNEDSKTKTKSSEPSDLKSTDSAKENESEQTSSDAKTEAKSGVAVKTSSAEIFKAEQKDEKTQDDDEEDHDFINIKADTEADDLLEPDVAEESLKEPVEKKAKTLVQAPAQEKTPVTEPAAPPSGRRIINLREESKFHKRTSPSKEDRTKEDRNKADRSADDRSTLTRQIRRRSPLPLSRKRPLSSRIGAIVSREEEDEQYDPANPAVGNVASVIRVKSRPKLALSAQANKNLLLKAMAEAQRSVANAPVRTDPGEARVGLLSRHNRIRLGLVPAEKSADIRPTVRTPLKRDQGEKYDRILIEVEGATVKNDKEVIDDSGDATSTVNEEVEEVVHSVQENSVKPRLGPIVKESPETEDSPKRKLIGGRVIQENTQSNVENERPRSPQFVVTLDGIDPKTFGDDNADDSKRRSSASEVSVEEDETDSALREDSGEDLDSFKKKRLRSKITITDEELKSKSERCKFWPVCRQGDKCIYHHPTVPCKIFPSCKFGEKCLYIHPNCKFDASCTRRDCPFTHASPRATTAFPAKSSQTVCRYFPTCSNVSCPFYHPKHCKFGKACTRSDCSFHHPELPSMDKLKWVCPTKS